MSIDYIIQQTRRFYQEKQAMQQYAEQAMQQAVLTYSLAKQDTKEYKAKLSLKGDNRRYLRFTRNQRIKELGKRYL